MWMALSTNSTHSKYLPSQRLSVCCVYVLPLDAPSWTLSPDGIKSQEKKSLNQGTQGSLKGNERIKNDL